MYRSVYQQIFSFTKHCHDNDRAESQCYSEQRQVDELFTLTS
jgi:hypothetical protein